MRRYIPLLLLACAASASARSIDFGEDLVPGFEIIEAPLVHLVVIGPGDNDYTLWGHAGLLVLADPDDPATWRLFNFGVTDFKRDNYVADFIKGRVEFWGEEVAWGRQLARWKRRDRTVTRYPLALRDGARRRLIARLERDVSPAHRDFVYDTFRENCTTRLRDYLDTYTGGAVFASTQRPGETNFRDNARRIYANRTGILLLSEVVPGVELDRPRTAWELMFMPAYFEARMIEVEVEGRPLLGPPIVEHSRAGPDPSEGSPHHAQLLLLILAAGFGVLGWWIRERGPRTRAALLLVALALTTTIGATLIWVGSTSAWPEMQRNPAVFVWVPLDVLLLWTAGRLALRRPGPAGVARAYLRARLVVGLALVGLTPVVDALAGSLAPRVLAVALIWAMLRSLGGQRGGPSPSRASNQVDNPSR